MLPCRSRSRDSAALIGNLALPDTTPTVTPAVTQTVRNRSARKIDGRRLLDVFGPMGLLMLGRYLICASAPRIRPSMAGARWRVAHEIGSGQQAPTGYAPYTRGQKTAIVTAVSAISTANYRRIDCGGFCSPFFKIMNPTFAPLQWFTFQSGHGRTGPIRGLVHHARDGG